MTGTSIAGCGYGADLLRSHLLAHCKPTAPEQTQATPNAMAPARAEAAMAMDGMVSVCSATTVATAAAVATRRWALPQQRELRPQPLRMSSLPAPPFLPFGAVGRALEEGREEDWRTPDQSAAAFTPHPGHASPGCINIRAPKAVRVMFRPAATQVKTDMVSTATAFHRSW